MADATSTPSGRAPEPTSGHNRRRFYRVTSRLRFRVAGGSVPPEVWHYRQGGGESALYRPGDAELQQARKLLAQVPRRTINLGEGGMRVRLPEEEPDHTLLQGGGRFHQRRVHILLAFDHPDGESSALFQLPARLVRVDRLPWAHFAAFEFYAVPDGLRQRLEGEVLAIERRRLRRHLVAFGSPDEGEAMAERLRRLEASELSRTRQEERPTLRRISRRNRFFP
jgi:hypothetical protein